MVAVWWWRYMLLSRQIDFKYLPRAVYNFPCGKFIILLCVFSLSLYTLNFEYKPPLVNSRSFNTLV